jgi:flagellar biosynthetic protein FliR
MNISYLSEIQMLVFALVLVRFSAFLVAFPIVEGASMPPMVKILFALTMTMVVYPVVNAKGLNPEILSGSLFVMVIKEAFMGLFIGFLARFFYHILTVCGELVTMAMGLSSDQLFNPQMDRSVTGVENFYLLLGGLFFLALNGHHIFIQGLVESFNAVPLAQNTINLFL